MNASAPGWQPDPSGRHEYRYWDGTAWTDDVSDAGATSVDPLPGLTPPGGAPPSGDPTAVIDPTQGYAPTAAYGTPTPPGGPGGSGDYPPAEAGPGQFGSGPTAGYPAYGGSGPVPPAKPPRSGPSTGLLVGLGGLAIALIVAIVVVLAGGDDDGDDDEISITDTTESPVTTEPDTPETTAGDDDDTTDTSIDLGDSGIDFDDPEVRDAIVDVVADQLEGSGFTREPAECFTGAMLDGLGPDRLAEIGASGGDMSSLTPEDMSSILDAVVDCGIEFPTAGTG